MCVCWPLFGCLYQHQITQLLILLHIYVFTFYKSLGFGSSADFKTKGVLIYIMIRRDLCLSFFEESQETLYHAMPRCGVLSQYITQFFITKPTICHLGKLMTRGRNFMLLFGPKYDIFIF